MVEQPILDSVQRYLQKLGDQGLRVSFGVLFGSHVKGTSHEWSDIDLLVVSTQFDNLDREDINRLWRVAARTDSRIEPVPCGLLEWTTDASKSIIEIARREGTRILPAV